MKIFNSEIDSGYFLVNYFEKATIVRNERQLEWEYNNFLDGYLNTANFKAYQNTIKDTSFSGTSGKWIKSVSDETKYREMLFYLTIANGHFYLIGYACLDSTDKNSQAKTEKFFQSIKFDSKNIKEYADDFKLEARSYRLGESIGYVLRILILAAVVVLLIYYFYFKRMKVRK
jgi:hypothetical protein